MISTGLLPFIGPSGGRARPYTSPGARVTSGASLDAYGVHFLQAVLPLPLGGVACKKFLSVRSHGVFLAAS